MEIVCILDLSDTKFYSSGLGFFLRFLDKNSWRLYSENIDGFRRIYFKKPAYGCGPVSLSGLYRFTDDRGFSQTNRDYRDLSG